MKFDVESSLRVSVDAVAAARDVLVRRFRSRGADVRVRHARRGFHF